MIDTHQFRRYPGSPFLLRGQHIDMLPIGTFLVEGEPGGDDLNPPYRVCRVVKPNIESNYDRGKLTPNGRLLYICWRDGAALKLLANIPGVRLTVRDIIQPGEPAFDTLDAFKIGCDTARAMANRPCLFPPTLLYRAIGYVPEPSEPLT